MSLSIRDTRLIDYVARGKTFEEIGLEFGVDPIVVSQRVYQIINSVDQWTATEMSKIIMIQMQDTMGTIKDRMEDRVYDVEWAEASVKMLKTISDHYMKMRDLSLKETELLGDVQLRGLKLLMEAAYQPMRDYITDNYPEVNITTVDNIFIDSLRNARA